MIKIGGSLNRHLGNNKFPVGWVRLPAVGGFIFYRGWHGKNKGKARKEYESFVKAGLKQGRKEELTGGGLIRSLGGWIEAREVLKSGVHIMSDERILGDSDFVDSVISQCDEHYERRHRLKRRGYDLERIAERVSEVLGMKPDEVFSKGR